MSVMKKWPFLWKLVESRHLLTIDCAFAENATSVGEAMLLAALFAFYRFGHLCLEINESDIAPSLKLLVSDAEEWEKEIRLVKESPFVLRENNRFYLPKIWQHEENFIKETKRLLKGSFLPLSLKSSKEGLTDQQQQAIKNAGHPLSLIAGGPGTGKSFTAIEIAKAFLENGKNAIFFAAPTGKAAANLEKRFPEIPTSTLHSLLGVLSQRHFQTEPPWIHVDLLLVDECSMIDPALFARLMKSIRQETRLVLMGDPHQLPAIEGGSFFADLLRSNAIPSTILTHPFRFERQELVDLSRAVLEVDMSRISATDFPPSSNAEEWIWERVKSHFPKASSSPIEKAEKVNNFRILTALRKGPFGVDALNQTLMSRFRSFSRFGEYLPIPILIGQNDVRTGLRNGDMGVLVHQIGSHENDYALFENGRRFLKGELPKFEYAYATSVHKSQGSEYEEVLVLLPEGSEVFGRELLYTAVTRAKSRVEIVGDSIRIKSMLGQGSGKISGVCDKLKI